MNLDETVARAVGLNASDIHMEEGKAISVRAQGHIYQWEEVCDAELVDELWRRLSVPVDGALSYDGALTVEGERLRAHLYYARQRRCATLRILYNRSLSLGNDGTSAVLKKLSLYKEGLILITGPTGSGKSYTLASCLSYINEQAAKHIVTLEDPVEFLFHNEKSIIHQRQLGVDIKTMADGVRDALREDPDVIMIGEMRDKETLEAGLHAAETGHLVFATMHTQKAVMAINRMLSMFPAVQQEEVRSQLSQVLRAVICQRLVNLDGQVVPVRDILLNTQAVANLIRQRKEPQIRSIQETQCPMQTMEMAVRELEKAYGKRQELADVLECNYEAI